MRILLALAMVLAVALPGTAAAADLHANPGNFASQLAAAQGGDRVLLASGAYGSFPSSTTKASPGVVVTEEAGAAATFSSSDFLSTTRWLTVQGVEFTGPVQVNVPTGTNVHLVFDGILMAAVGAGTHEGRLSINGAGTNAIAGNGVQVKNSTFGPGGCSDGIQDSSHGTEIGPGNEFRGIVQGSCSEHADAVQPYDGDYAWIHDNYMHDNEQGIMSPDGPAAGYLFENNVISTTNAYPCITVGYGQNGTIRHNVCINGNVRVYQGNQGVASTGMRVQDNSPGVNVTSCNGCTVDHNQQVTYTGGTGRCAYATASPKGTASDGTDIGLNDCGGSPPPPTDSDGDGVPDSSDLCPGTPAGTAVDSTGCPFGPPPVDHTPVARFTASPEPSAPGQTVTFDGTASTCDDTPCTYHWHDTGPPVAGSCAGTTGDWPVGSNGSTTTQAFSGTGTKCVELVLTDADGDVDKVEHDHVVSNAPPPPPDTTAPDTSISSAPASGTSTSASVSFAGTDNTTPAGSLTFECKLDAAAYASCTSPKAYSGLAVGSHTFSVRAIDAAGNVDQSPATATWTVSSAPPTGTPPVFRGEAETSWTTTTSPKTVSLAVAPGDVLVAYSMAESNSTLTIGGGTANLVWSTPRVAISTAGFGALYVWTATVGGEGGATATVTFTRSGAGGQYGGNVLRYSGSTGIGAVQSKTGTGAPSLAITTTANASALVKVNDDWAAGSGAARNSLTAGVGAFTETTYNQSSQYTVYGGYHANAGQAGAKTIGYSAPAGQTYSLAGIEVKGT